MIRFIGIFNNGVHKFVNRHSTLTVWKTALLFVAMLFVAASPLHAQDDDELNFKSNKAKTALGANQFYYVSGDTVSFFADAFVLPEGAMLDRLLRKLPGVEYMSNSSIVIDGTTIKEMRVEGKEYFKNAMTSVLKRIPAYCIDQVKFYDYDQGKRMNIVLKRQFRGQWFAEFSAGIGPEGRYSDKAFAMNNSKRLRATIFANANDINDTRQPGQETEWSPATMAKNEVKSEVLGTEYMWKRKNQDMTGYALVTHSATDATTDVDKTNLMLSGNTRQLSASNASKRSLKVDTYHDFHSRQGNLDFHVKPRFQYTDTHNRTDKSGSLSMTDGTPVNRTHSFTDSHADSYNAQMVASASIKFDHKRKQLKAEAGATAKGGSENELTDEQIDYLNLDADSTYRYSQRLHTHPERTTEFYGKGEYQWARRGLLGVVQYKFKRSTSHEMLEETALKQDNSHDSREQSNTHELVGKLHYEHATTWGTWSFNAYVPVDIVSTHTDFRRPDYSRSYCRHYLTADVKNTYLQWRSRDTRQRVTLLYDVSTTVPEAEMLQDVTNTVDRQNYYAGNPSLKNQTTHQTRLKYLFLGLDTRHEFSVMLKYNKVYNAITTRLSYDNATGRRRYVYDNANGNRTATLTLTLGTPLDRGCTLYLHDKLESGLNRKVSLDETQGNVVSKHANVYTVDNDFRLKWLVDAGQTLTLRSRFQMSYANNNGSPTRPIDWECGLLAQCSLPWNLGLSTDVTLYRRLNYKSSEMNTSDWVCNARLVRPFFHDKLLVVLEGFDIFHQLKNITHTVTSDAITNTRTNVIPSYAMICAVYRLNYKKATSKPRVHWF